MTKLLSDLLYDYGLLHVTLASLEEARAEWSQKFGQVVSQEDLATTAIEDDEPVIVVMPIPDSEKGSIHRPGDHDFQAIDTNGISHTKNVYVLELPLGEFHFFSGFTPGIRWSQTRTP